MKTSPWPPLDPDRGRQEGLQTPYLYEAVFIFDLQLEYYITFSHQKGTNHNVNDQKKRQTNLEYFISFNKIMSWWGNSIVSGKVLKPFLCFIWVFASRAFMFSFSDLMTNEIARNHNLGKSHLVFPNEIFSKNIDWKTYRVLAFSKCNLVKLVPDKCLLLNGTYLLSQWEEVLMQGEHSPVERPIMCISWDHARVLLHAVPVSYRKKKQVGK